MSSAHAHKLAIFDKFAAKNDRISDQEFNTIFTGEAPERGNYEVLRDILFKKRRREIYKSFLQL